MENNHLEFTESKRLIQAKDKVFDYCLKMA